MVSDHPSEDLLLLGRDFGEYGSLELRRVGLHTAVALSVGSDRDSPSRIFKHDPSVMNEDVLSAVETPTHACFAVADAHYGPEASHFIGERLHAIWRRVRPMDLTHLSYMLEFLATGAPAVTESESTIVAVSYDRSTRAGFGLSIGDSSFMIVPRDGSLPITRNRHDALFATTSDEQTLAVSDAFQFTAQSGDLLLTFTDGINECHYRSPETSIQPRHIAEVAAAADYDPFDTAERIARLALSGVDDNPGGQDNIALIVSRA